MKTLTKIFALALAVLISQSARAACSSPAGVAGQLQWISAVSKIQWCDGTSWIDTTNAAGGACSSPGLINYSAGVLSYCNGSNYRSMKGPAAGSCAGTTAGTYTYNVGANKFRFCDGATWYDMTPGSPSGVSKVVILTSGSSWTVPDDWNNANNSVECIGGGAGGNGSPGDFHNQYGGGGGAYAKVSNFTFTVGSSVSYQIGAGGAARVADSGSGDHCCSGLPGGNSWFSSAATLLAAGAPSITGGSVASSIGNVRYAGGNSSSSTSPGGGAGGPTGNGGNSTGSGGAGGGTITAGVSAGNGAPANSGANIPGYNYGGGGGGSSGGFYVGTSGANGVCVIKYVTP